MDASSLAVKQLPSRTHLAAIEDVIQALPADMDIVRAMIVLEDAYVALMLGAQCGLTLKQTTKNLIDMGKTIPTDGGIGVRS